MDGRDEGEPRPLRVPPYNEEAEMALLGCILFDNKCYERVVGIITVEMLAVEIHRRIYEACGKLISRLQPANPTTLKGYFEHDSSLGEVGGTRYLGKLAAAVVTTINVESYAQNIRDLYLRRRLIDTLHARLDQAYKIDFENSAADHIDALQAELNGLGDIGSSAYRNVTLGEAVDAALEQAADAEARGTGVSGIRCGLHALDRILGGFQPGVYILGGRTSMGKTSLARAIAVNVATASHRAEPNAGPVLYFSFEMTATQMGAAVVGPMAGLTSKDMITGQVGENWQKLIEAQAHFQALPLVFDDRAGLTVMEIHTAAKRMKRERGALGMFVIDLLRYVKPPPETRNMPRNVMLGEHVRAIKGIAKSLGVPILLLHQLSRQTEKRDDNRPQLTDLKDSGDIEEDADCVLFVYREHSYLAAAEPKQEPRESDGDFGARMADWHAACARCEHIGEVIVAKNRLTGSTGTARLFWDGRFAKFSNLKKDDGQQEML